MRQSIPPTGRRRVIPEIQALRALAVSLVLLFHLFPDRLPGGYVGVDVFFVVSGYLISSHLVSEHERAGRVSLSAFYARRIRRLLPASLLVLAASLLAVVIWVPRTLWVQFFSEIGASALYVENWLLAGNAVDYLAATNTASPAQHYWSLSVEEQFYLVWPLLVLLVGLILRRISQGSQSRAAFRSWLAAVFLLVFVLSLTFSVWEGVHNTAASYFITPVRAWEFAAGGLIALLPLAISRTLLRPGLIVAGVVLVVVSAFWFDRTTVFPGYAALLPVIGTGMVLAASARGPSGFVTRAAEFVPISRLGDISYGVYLWHWPLIVVVPYAVGHALGFRWKVAIIVVTLLLAALTKKFVEDPVRERRFWRIPAWRSFAFAGAGMAAIILAVVGGTGVVQQQNNVTTASVSAKLSSQSSCFGAAALAPGAECSDPFAVTSTANATFAKNDIGTGVALGPCELGLGTEVQPPCEFGDTTNPQRTVAVIGDSHAGQMIDALTPYAKTHGILLKTFIKSSCPGLTGDQDTGSDECLGWGANMLSQVASDPSIEDVLVVNATSKYRGTAAYLLTPKAIAQSVQKLQAAGKTVIVIRDPPASDRGEDGMGGTDFPECIASSKVKNDPCIVPQARVVTDDLMVQAGARADGLIDLTGFFCTDGVCHSVIGGLIVYSDGGHVSKSYAATLSPYLGAALTEILARRPVA